MSQGQPRVGYDATPASMGSTGVARYVLRLHSALAAQGCDVVPYAFGRGPYPVPDGTRRGRLPYRVVRGLVRATGRPTVESLTGAVDLVHVTDLVPAPTLAPTVLTVHDLVALEHPELHSPRQRQAQTAQLAAARRADLVLVDAGVTGAALRARGVTAPIVIAPLAASPARPSLVSPVAGQFLLAVGELAARKDLATLVAGFHAARMPRHVRLVLAGPDGYGASAVHPLADDRVILLGRVPDDQLAALYRDALALCSSSVAEGFNLPLVEAFAAGLAVAVSDLPVAREVAGDAAALVPVGDIAAWAETCGRLVEDPGFRADLAARGRARSASYSWSRTANITRSAYATVLR